MMNASSILFIFCSMFISFNTFADEKMPIFVEGCDLVILCEEDPVPLLVRNNPREVLFSFDHNHSEKIATIIKDARDHNRKVAINLLAIPILSVSEKPTRYLFVEDNDLKDVIFVEKEPKYKNLH